MIPATSTGEVTAPAPAMDISRVLAPTPAPTPAPAPTPTPTPAPTPAPTPSPTSKHLPSSVSFSYQKFLATPLH